MLIYNWSVNWYIICLDWSTFKLVFYYENCQNCFYIHVTIGTYYNEARIDMEELHKILWCIGYKLNTSDMHLQIKMKQLLLEYDLHIKRHARQYLSITLHRGQPIKPKVSVIFTLKTWKMLLILPWLLYVCHWCTNCMPMIWYEVIVYFFQILLWNKLTSPSPG